MDAATRSLGPKPKLTPRQLQKLKETIVGRNPLQLAFGTALWSLPVVAAYVQREFDVVLHESTVSRLLRRIGLTPQKPQRRAFQRDDDACREWASKEFPAIVRAAKRKQANILFGDETGVREDQSSCGPSSQLPRFAGLQGCGGPTGFVVKGAVDVDPRRAGSPGGAQRQRAGRRM